jgi:NMD protein affecting ribosome stability and mRNA decay
VDRCYVCGKLLQQNKPGADEENICQECYLKNEKPPHWS